ncbi:MAG TPA: tripartite tricarboxylate transporter substrate binding protein [Burkholderiales bacterium]|nr:tripartite tricarboxylate transporter substrate binding protein [Burkholderiales bacterium]
MQRMKLSRRRFVHLATGAVALPAAWRAARADTYPARPVRILVGFAPGVAPDIAARLIAQRLSERLGQQFIVENRAGAGGNIGTEITATSVPDGYTVMLCTLGSHAITPARKKLPYDHIKDFSFIALMGSTANVLVGHPSLGMKNVGDVVTYAKAHPGKLSYGSSGVGTGPHMSIELFKYMTGSDIVHVAYKGAAPALTDAMGGQIPLSTGNLPGGPLAAIKAGKVTGLGVTTAKRNSRAPEIPTFAEGGVRGYEVTAWYGICAPAGVPPAIVAKLNAGLVKVLNSPALQQRLEEQGIDVTPSTPAQFAAHVKAETAKWAKVVKAMGLEEK